METYFYQCPQCGFVHQVPAYWVNFSPEKQMILAHVDLNTGDTCSCQNLTLLEE
jgi:hypothetical protein